jgi:hypothetical protein
VVWNVRGLNSKARRQVVKEIVLRERASIICLQETKMAVIKGVVLHPALVCGDAVEKGSMWTAASHSKLLAVHVLFTAFRA